MTNFNLGKQLEQIQTCIPKLLKKTKTNQKSKDEGPK